MKIINSLSSINTVTEKKVNEDHIDFFYNKSLNFKGIVLGDGIGSHYKPEVGSSFCVSKLIELLKNCNSEGDLNFSQFFHSVSQALKKEFAKSVSKLNEVEPNKAYGTTLICILEFERDFKIAYVGNGSVWHLRGNYPTLINRQRYLPWSALNLLNPHTIDEGGKEVLYKFFALETLQEQTEPNIITITKDNSIYGDVLIATTDGLYSNDHIPVAKDKEGDLWIAGEKKMEMLFNNLKKFSEVKSMNDEQLNDILNSYCKEIKELKLLDDDTTFGLFYSEKAIEYQKLKNAGNSSN